MVLKRGMTKSVGTLRNYDGDGKENVKKAVGLISKTTTLHVHHAFLYISLLSLHNYDVKWAILSFFLGRERTNAYGKAINSTISVWSRVRPPLFSSNLNSLLLTNRANWDNCEKVWHDAKSIFQRRFHGRCRCRIVRSLVFRSETEVTKICTKSVFSLTSRCYLIDKMT